MFFLVYRRDTKITSTNIYKNNIACISHSKEDKTKDIRPKLFFTLNL